MNLVCSSQVLGRVRPRIINEVRSHVGLASGRRRTDTTRHSLGLRVEFQSVCQSATHIEVGMRGVGQ